MRKKKSQLSNYFEVQLQKYIQLIILKPFLSDIFLSSDLFRRFKEHIFNLTDLRT